MQTSVLSAATPDDFRARLTAAADVSDSWLLAGLDPVLDTLPAGVSRDADGVIAFHRAIIDATSGHVLGYKLNFAFYEALGADAWRVLDATRRAIPRRLLAFADAKRGDIGHTAAAYARSIFDVLGFDAVTLMPYGGVESVAPFLHYVDRGCFVVCRTSNRDETIQTLPVDGRPLYVKVAEIAAGWGPNVGLVVGATDVEALQAVREAAPAVPMLIPGIGPQGGELAAAVQVGATDGGWGAIIAVSRAVAGASQEHDFAAAAEVAAAALHESIRRALAAKM